MGCSLAIIVGAFLYVLNGSRSTTASISNRSRYRSRRCLRRIRGAASKSQQRQGIPGRASHRFGTVENFSLPSFAFFLDINGCTFDLLSTFCRFVVEVFTTYSFWHVMDMPNISYALWTPEWNGPLTADTERRHAKTTFKLAMLQIPIKRFDLVYFLALRTVQVNVSISADWISDKNSNY